MMRVPCRPARLLPGLLTFLLAASCLTPTDDGGRFGELRVQPVFDAGSEPAVIDISIDSLLATVQRQGGTVLVDTLMAYDSTRALAWALELLEESDALDVTLELRSHGAAAYRGKRTIKVDERTIGRSVLEVVPVAYVGAPLAGRIEIMPARTALTAVGMERQLGAVAYDASGAVIPGKTFTWSTDDAAVATVDQDGLVTAAGADSTTVRAGADGVTGSATVLVSLDGTFARNTDISTDSSSLRANGESATRVLVTVRDTNGKPIGASAGTVVLVTTLGSLSAVTDRGDGTYTATLTAGTTAGPALITGTLNDDAIADSALVELRPFMSSPTTTTIDADSMALDADGLSSTRVLVTARDAKDNPIDASVGTVALATTLGSLSAVTDHGDGTYTAVLTAGTRAGSALITGTVNDDAIEDSALVELRPTMPSPATTIIDADSTAMDANGQSMTRVLVTVRDVHGNLIGANAGTVVLTTTLGSLSAITDHGDGTYTAMLTAVVTAGTALITGTLNDEAITDFALVELRPTTPSSVTTTIDADSTAIDSDGPSTTRVLVTVRDVNGNLIGASAGTVTLATTLGSLSAVTDHGDGTYTAMLTAGTTSGSALITGTLNDDAIADSARVELRAVIHHRTP